jgi:hypothetical protein
VFILSSDRTARLCFTWMTGHHNSKLNVIPSHSSQNTFSRIPALPVEDCISTFVRCQYGAYDALSLFEAREGRATSHEV